MKLSYSLLGGILFVVVHSGGGKFGNLVLVLEGVVEISALPPSPLVSHDPHVCSRVLSWSP